MMKSRFLVLFSLLFLLGAPQSFSAYVDEVGVGVEEAFQAAQDALKDHGIYKIREEKYEVESKWIEDRVVRKSRGLLAGMAKKNYLRRYRIKIRIVEVNEVSVRIEIRGSFQQKPIGNAPGSPWKTVRNQPEDFNLEKDFFHRVMRQMRLKRI